MKRATIGLTIIAVVILSGCVADRWIGIEPGQYVAVNRTGATNTTPLAEIQTLEIDRDKRLAIFTWVDGAEIIVPFVPRDRAVWPSGCPTNINATRMEVLDIEENLLTIGAVTLSNPVLVRECPPDPMRIVLREDSAIGGGGGACTHLNRCIFFELQTTPALLTTPLPSSPKGYELYSWYVEQKEEWYYTLITATNRLKTYQEITTAENRVIKEGWVKITVKGVDSLKELLGRLPQGEKVFWMDGTRLEQMPDEGRRFGFPDKRVVDEFERYCRQLGLELHLAGRDG